MRIDKAKKIVDTCNRYHAIVNYNTAIDLMDLITDDELEVLMKTYPKTFLPVNNKTIDEILAQPEALKDLCNLFFTYLKRQTDSIAIYMQFGNPS